MTSKAVLVETSVNPTGSSGAEKTHKNCPKLRQGARPLYPCKGLKREPCVPGQCPMRGTAGSLQQPEVPAWGLHVSAPKRGLNRTPPAFALSQWFPYLAAPGKECWRPPWNSTLKYKPIAILRGPAFLPHPSAWDNYLCRDLM